MEKISASGYLSLVMNVDHAIDQQRMERAIVAMAAIVVRHGPRYAPLLERLEREYTARFSDPIEHAQAILDSYRSLGQRLKAIR